MAQRRKRYGIIKHGGLVANIRFDPSHSFVPTSSLKCTRRCYSGRVSVGKFEGRNQMAKISLHLHAARPCMIADSQASSKSVVVTGEHARSTYIADNFDPGGNKDMSLCQLADVQFLLSRQVY